MTQQSHSGHISRENYNLKRSMHLSVLCSTIYMSQDMNVKSLSHVRLFVTPWSALELKAGSSAHGIFKARILEWVAISFSRRSSRPRDWTHVSLIVGRHFTREVHLRSYVCVCVCESLTCVCLFATPWTVAHQASLSVEFCRQEQWSGLPFPSPFEVIREPYIRKFLSFPKDQLPHPISTSPHPLLPTVRPHMLRSTLWLLQVSIARPLKGLSRWRGRWLS